MPGWDSHRAALIAMKPRALKGCMAAVDAALAPIVQDAIEKVTKDTGVLESTIQQSPAEAEGTFVKGFVNAGSAATLSGWPASRKGKRIVEPHGAGGSAGVGPIWSDVGREIFQEFGTATNTPAVHYLEDATVGAMSGMLEREAAAFDGAV